MENTFHFDGNSWIKFQKTCDIVNTFTYEFWVKAEEKQILDLERSTGVDGISGKKYLVAPNFYPSGSAGFGISIGTNGISIHDHSVNSMPARLVCSYDFSNWQHVAIVSDNKKLSLYINGEWIKEEGAASEFEFLHPSLTLGGHIYGMFKGHVKEFRLWSTARTKAEIQADLFSSLSGTEKGLYFYRNPGKGIVVSDGALQNITASVIMPSYNRFPLSHFSLESLNRQQFPLNQIEVVFLDDNSSDLTASVGELVSPDYSFIYVQSRINRGRSKIRNIGARIAAAPTFVFIDADIICGPDFISNHIFHHQQGERKVVSGALRSKRIYTMTDPGFSQEQIKQMKEYHSGNQSASLIIDSFIQGNTRPMQLLSMNQMFEMTELNKWSRSLVDYENALGKYGNQFEGFHYRWVSVITNNVSMEKRLFEEIGGFDEAFEGFGWEDWELGYRADRNGAIFIHDDAVINFHQEHPISAENMMQSQRNFLKICNKYPDDVGVKLLGLVIIRGEVMLSDANEYLKEYQHIRATYPTRFTNFYNYVETALNRLAERLQEHKGSDLSVTEALTSSDERAAVQDDLQVIRKMGTYPRLLELYNRLSR